MFFLGSTIVQDSSFTVPASASDVGSGGREAPTSPAASSTRSVTRVLALPFAESLLGTGSAEGKKRRRSKKKGRSPEPPPPKHAPVPPWLVKLPTSNPKAVKSGARAPDLPRPSVPSKAVSPAMKRPTAHMAALAAPPAMKRPAAHTAAPMALPAMKRPAAHTAKKAKKEEEAEEGKEEEEEAGAELAEEGEEEAENVGGAVAEEGEEEQEEDGFEEDGEEEEDSGKEDEPELEDEEPASAGIRAEKVRSQTFQNLTPTSLHPEFQNELAPRGRRLRGAKFSGWNVLCIPSWFVCPQKVVFKDAQGATLEVKAWRRNCEHMSAISVGTAGVGETKKKPFKQILSLKDSWWGEDIDEGRQKELSVAAGKATSCCLQLPSATWHALDFVCLHPRGGPPPSADCGLGRICLQGFIGSLRFFVFCVLHFLFFCASKAAQQYLRFGLRTSCFVWSPCALGDDQVLFGPPYGRHDRYQRVQDEVVRVGG